MLALLISLLCWIPADGVCSGSQVKISLVKSAIPVGAPFSVTCEFTCLSPQHVAQMWRESTLKEKVSLINITSTQPNVTMELNISQATSNHSGNYNCKTHPPETISSPIYINVSGNPITNSSPPSSVQLSSPAGLQGQMWYWMILGKIIIFIITSASLAVKYRTA